VLVRQSDPFPTFPLAHGPPPTNAKHEQGRIKFFFASSLAILFLPFSPSAQRAEKTIRIPAAEGARTRRSRVQGEPEKPWPAGAS